MVVIHLKPTYSIILSSARKQEELRQKFDSTPAIYRTALSAADSSILDLSLAELVSTCGSADVFTPLDVLEAYGKRALEAHNATNCLADIFLDEAAENASIPPATSELPLLGVPVSIKECFDVAGHDTTVGFSSRVGHPALQSAPLLRLLRDAGALVYVKTTLPTACLSFETSSDLFGRTTNPFNPAFSPGASTGGGAALLAWQGSLIEVGTDLGGSSRYPAAFCGLYAVKGSAGRFPNDGSLGCLPGLDAVPTITAPLARSLSDLRDFWERIVRMRPWEYDHTCVPLTWRPSDYVTSGQKLKFGLIMDDGVIPPTPANARALAEVADALRKQGHEVVSFHPPSPLEGLKIGYQLMFADGGASAFIPLRTGESISPALRTVRTILRLPLWLKRLQASFLRWWSTPKGRNDAWADLLACFHPRSALEEHGLVLQRDAYRARWHDAWRREGLDFVLTPVHALPAMPIEPEVSDKATLVSANYSFLYNVLDYAAGVLPVGRVDKARDSYTAGFKKSDKYRGLSDVARQVHEIYDAEAMDGLPLSVQVVAGRFEEEKALAGMEVVEAALRESGRPFVPQVL
ncbi:amidase signature enzyme [Epithele typhae]|uniref:amidase signature enzyme n=1 Tax=Epithele typhae TaxID=378194 RepID=UPI002008ACD4|nr:amidase signature enzyme [Epithele typhae]KAH9941326.1 amidase signature enzyme [Epithele typhae]